MEKSFSELLNGYTSAALEFGIRSLLNSHDAHQNDFISNWVSLIKTTDAIKTNNVLAYSKSLQKFQPLNG